MRSRSHADTPEGKAARAADLASARTVLATAHTASAAPEEAEPSRRALLEVLEALADAKGPSEDAKALLLEALDLAARSKVSAVLQTGDRIGHRLLGEDGFRKLLTPQAVTDIERQLESIRQALSKKN
jgi:hypothetical protein